MRSRKSLVLVVLLTACLLPATAADVPQWLADAARLALPDRSPETEAVVLLDEQNTKVSPDGTIFTSGRRALKVLRQVGIEEVRRLVLASAYDVKIRSMTGWNVTEGRKTLKVTSCGRIPANRAASASEPTA